MGRIALVTRTSFACAAAALAALALAGPAHAGFPGANGRVAFQSNQDGDYEVFTVDSAGAGLQQLTTNSATDGGPSWSPDGTEIVFATNRDGNFEVYKMNANGTGQTRLTTNAASDGSPSWSPTGTQIVFASDRDGNLEIYKMNADGTGQTRLTNNAVADEYPAWSPSGTKIAFHRATPNLEVFTMNTDGSGQVNVTNNAAHDSVPDWSPDGDEIAFVSTRSGAGDIYSMNADGTNQALFKGNAASDNSPAYAPLGDQVTWAQHNGANFDLMKGNAALVGTQSLLYGSAGQDESPDWQPLNNTYARPKSASPISLPLVPAYKECTAPNTTHRGFTQPGCYGPKPESSWLTVGTPDYNGAGANSVGSLRMAAFCNGGAVGEQPPCLTTAGDQLDGKIQLTLSDVRCQAASGGCASALADYTGQLWLFAHFRLTDKNFGPAGTVGPSGNATSTNLTVDFGVPCTATGSTTIGSTCSITTSFDAVLGSSNAVAEQKRGVWELNGGLGGRSIALYDGGSNGVFGIGDTVFATAGLFFP